MVRVGYTYGRWRVVEQRHVGGGPVAVRMAGEGGRGRGCVMSQRVVDVVQRRSLHRDVATGTSAAPSTTRRFAWKEAQKLGCESRRHFRGARVDRSVSRIRRPLHFSESWPAADRLTTRLASRYRQRLRLRLRTRMRN